MKRIYFIKIEGYTLATATDNRDEAVKILRKACEVNGFSGFNPENVTYFGENVFPELVNRVAQIAVYTA